MKKCVLILAVLLSCVMVFAESSWVWNGQDKTFPQGGNISVPVTLSTKETLQADIGFTSKAVTVTNGKLTLSDLINAETGVPLSVNTNNGKASNSETGKASPIYATWLIQSGEDIDVFLCADGKLKLDPDDSENQIGWKVTRTDSDSTITYIDCMSSGSSVGIFDTSSVPTESPNNVYVYQHKPTSKTKFKSYGSKELKIETESVWEKKAGSYKANLYMVIVSDSQGEETT